MPLINNEDHMELCSDKPCWCIAPKWRTTTKRHRHWIV